MEFHGLNLSFGISWRSNVKFSYFEFSFQMHRNNSLLPSIHWMMCCLEVITAIELNLDVPCFFVVAVSGDCNFLHMSEPTTVYKRRSTDTREHTADATSSASLSCPPDRRKIKKNKYVWVIAAVVSARIYFFTTHATLIWNKKMCRFRWDTEIYIYLWRETINSLLISYKVLLLITTGISKLEQKLMKFILP